jgi:hypothetical protein
MTTRIPTIPTDTGVFSVSASNSETDRGVFTPRGSFYIYATGVAGGATCVQLAFTRAGSPGSGNRWKIPVNQQIGPFSMMSPATSSTHVYTQTDAGTATVYFVGYSAGA